MTFEKNGKCSGCEVSDLLLNDYGTCANCWADFNDDQRQALVSVTGLAPVSYRIEPPRLLPPAWLVMLAGFIGGGCGFGFSSLLALFVK